MWTVFMHSLQVRRANFFATKMVKEFHATYRTQMFIAVFTKAHQLRGTVKTLMTFTTNTFPPLARVSILMPLHNSAHTCWQAVSVGRDLWKRHVTVKSRPTYHTLVFKHQLF